MKKKVLFAMLVIFVVGGGFFVGSVLVNAQSRPAPLTGLAAAIANHFNLNQSEVQIIISAYMQQQRAHMQQTLQQRQKTRLNKLVSQGKISSSQENEIITELQSVQKQHNAYSKQQNITVLRSWALSKGINPQFVLPFGVHISLHTPKTQPSPI